MGPASRSFDLSGFGVHIGGLDDACAAVFDDVWGLFAGDGGRPVAHFHVRSGEGTLTPGCIDDAPPQRAIDGERIGIDLPQVTCPHQPDPLREVEFGLLGGSRKGTGMARKRYSAELIRGAAPADSAPGGSN